jgi:hypothetical protein
MFWVIRWTDFRTFVDHSIVVEAETRADAETIALKRNIQPVFLGPAEDGDVAEARATQRLWRYTPEPSPWQVFGRPIKPMQVACLMLLGVSTIGVLLQSAGLLAGTRIWI